MMIDGQKSNLGPNEQLGRPTWPERPVISQLTGMRWAITCPFSSNKLALPCNMSTMSRKNDPHVFLRIGNSTVFDS